MKKSVLELHREQKEWKKLLGKEVKILQTFDLENRQLALVSLEGKELLLPMDSTASLKAGDTAKLSLGARGKTPEGVHVHGLLVTSL